MKSCFFIGHASAPEAVLPLLEEAIEKHIAEYGVQEFIVGRYGAFDGKAAAALVRAKRRHPEIILRQLIPYHPSQHHEDLWYGFDSTYYPPGMESVPPACAIPRANRYMVSHCDYLIAYVWHTASNSKKILEYARRLEKAGRLQVENLADALTPESR